MADEPYPFLLSLTKRCVVSHRRCDTTFSWILLDKILLFTFALSPFTSNLCAFEPLRLCVKNNVPTVRQDNSNAPYL